MSGEDKEKDDGPQRLRESLSEVAREREQDNNSNPKREEERSFLGYIRGPKRKEDED